MTLHYITAMHFIHRCGCIDCAMTASGGSRLQDDGKGFGRGREESVYVGCIGFASRRISKMDEFGQYSRGDTYHRD